MELAHNKTPWKFKDIAHVKSLIDLMPINVMYCDRELIIRYVNRRSLETFKTIEHLMPVRANAVEGAKIDVFHKDPAFQKRLLSDDKNLPHRAVIRLGDEQLELNIQAVYSAKGDYVGNLVTWSVVTEHLKSQSNLARVKSMMENAPVNIMAADLDLTLVYMNPRAKQTLKSLEQYLPKPVEELLGQPIDIFHKNPASQRQMLKDDRHLPHVAKIRLGPETLELNVSAVYDQDKKYVGPMVTWQVLTDKVALVTELEDTALQLAASAEELSATAAELSRNAGLAAQQSMQAAASTEEVSTGVRMVATNTEEMVASIKEISRNTAEAAGVSKETLRQTNQTNQTISKLGTASIEIGNVIKVINSIAQQTNLLALNATIEAARAGDAGKGFAVVANEVKELAKQTAKATEDITQRISSIQGETKGAVEAMNSIGEFVEKLNAFSVAIAAAVEEQTATTNDVARVVRESSQGVETISQVVRSASVAADENKYGAQQTMEAAKGMTELSEKLRAMVKQIKV